MSTPVLLVLVLVLVLDALLLFRVSVPMFRNLTQDIKFAILGSRMRKHLLVDALLLVMLGQLSLATQAASLQTRENTVLSVPAASIAAGGIPGSTNLAGTNFIMSSVVPATSYGGKASLASTQQWVGQLATNSDTFKSTPTAMALRPDGSVVVTGYSESVIGTNGYNFLTLCYAADGTPLWTNFYDGPDHGDDFPYYIAAGTNGDVWVAGQSMRYATNSDFTDAVLLCYSNNGVPLWTNRYTSGSTNGDESAELSVDGSGNAYLHVATLFGTPTGDVIVKFDPFGNPLWTNTFPAYTVEIVGGNPAGNLFIATPSGTNGALLKLAPDSTPLWTNYHAFNSFDWQFRSVQCNPQGDVIVTAEYFINHVTNDTVNYVLLKYSSATGNLLWTNTMAGPQYDGGSVPQALATLAGDVLLVGGVADAPSTGLYQIMKFDSNGVPVWTNLNANFGTNSELEGAAVDNAGNLYLTIDARHPTNSSADFLTAKYSTTGQPVWTNMLYGSAYMADDPMAMIVNGMGEVIVTGQSQDPYFFNFTTVAYADALNYTPSNNFVGLDTISYTLTDAFGNSAAGSVQVMVTSTNFELLPMGAGFTPAGFQLQAEGAPGTNVVIIQASTDLIHWKPLFTNAPVQGAVEYMDSSAPDFPHRFYRAEQLP